MTVTSVVIVYSKKQKVRRRVIKLDHAGAHHGHFKPHKDLLHKGEGWLEIPIQLYESFKNDELDEHLVGVLGALESDRCVVVCPVDKTVKHVVRADPDIDFHPAGKILHHKTAKVGDEP